MHLLIIGPSQEMKITLVISPTCLVYPEFSDDNIVDDSFDFTPGVMIAGVRKLEVSNTQGFDLQIFALELRPHGEFLPTSPQTVCAFAKLSNHWRVVRHLAKKNVKFELLLPSGNRSQYKNAER